MRWLDGIINSMDMGLGGLRELVMNREAWRAVIHRVAKNRLTHLNCYTSEPSSLVAQMVKCLPTMWETRVQSLGWEDLLEKEMATHSSILATSS